jgi:hypothetical protein
MRCTLVGEMPARAASSRFDQCVPPSGTSSKVRTTTSSTWASVMVRGTPGRGSSLSPSSRFRKNRARHLLTVLRLTPSRAATARLLPPCAQASTIRARNARPCAVLRRLVQFSNVRRSASDNTSGSSLVSAITPADLRPPAPSPPHQSPETQHDSSGEERTQDRITSCWIASGDYAPHRRWAVRSLCGDGATGGSHGQQATRIGPPATWRRGPRSAGSIQENARGRLGGDVTLSHGRASGERAPTRPIVSRRCGPGRDGSEPGS